MIQTHIFDLDKTIWDCKDKYGNSIWAKQLLPPYKIKGDEIIDDVGSICKLRKGVRKYLTQLQKDRVYIGYCSVGRIYGIEDVNQPSINILKLFKLDQFDETISFLGYKTDSKKEHVKKFSKCFFYDDDEKHLKAVESLNEIRIINTRDLMDWNTLKIEE